MRAFTRYSIFSLACLFLSGCITTNYGNFSDNAENINKKMAADALNQLTLLYPPAHTQFALRQTTSDPFGAGLLSGLRKKGYAISEFDPENTVSKTGAVSLNYIVDPLEIKLYRVTLMMGKQSLSRAYAVENNAVSPAGAWMRKES